MTDQFLESLPVLSDATSAVVYGVKGGVDYQIPTSVIQNSINPQGANLVYAGPVSPPGDFPEFRPLVQADIPDLSSLYLASTGGSLSTATISNSTFVGGTISGATITVNDNAFTVRDQTDTTKRFQFEASGIAAGNTRVYSVPDGNTTLVGTDSVQTLTNKIVRTSTPSTAAAPLRIPHGTAPTSPANGDIWTTTAGLFVRVNSATVGPLAAATGTSVNSFNGRVGTVTLNSTDVITALGYTPANASTVALDADVVHDTGNETIAGIKTFSSTIVGNISGNAGTLSGISVSAGNGLTGGGALSASRTISLGTPSTTTQYTNNASTTSSHTHFIDVTYNAADLTDSFESYGSRVPTVGQIASGVGSVVQSHLTWGSTNTRVGQLLVNVAGGSSTPEVYIRAYHPTEGGGGWTAPQRLWTAGNFNPATKADDSSVMHLTGVETALGIKNFTDGIRVSAPADYWSGGANYYDVGGLGQLHTNGSNYVTLTSNGYRNNGGTWTSINAAGNTGAAVIALDPAGRVRFYTDAVKATGSSVFPTERARIEDTGADFFVPLKVSGTPVMLETWSITAGNGMTGGGSGAANRTITLGTPGSLTGSTTNAVTSTSHTHAITVNLSITGTTGARTITSSAGTSAVIPEATASVSGLVSTGNQTWGGTKTAPNFVASSDARLKKNIKTRLPSERLADMLRFVEYLWKNNDEQGVGVIAQEVRVVAPEYVFEDENGMLAVDKAGLALECVIGLAARVRELENK